MMTITSLIVFATAFIEYLWRVSVFLMLSPIRFAKHGEVSIWGPVCQKLSGAGTSQLHPTVFAGCNYLQLPLIPESGTLVLISEAGEPLQRYISFVTTPMLMGTQTHYTAMSYLKSHTIIPKLWSRFCMFYRCDMGFWRLLSCQCSSHSQQFIFSQIYFPAIK